ncbi:MAG: histidine phosphatase family protein [Anaerolineae bacterium]|nr:histidine phosphatase family protein [Thermoflexales bacterium]MDW8395803.1 histidine phosphatase family protein [Anaerolineae bacterium]
MTQADNTTSLPRCVWLVRHAQADWNRQQRYMSHTDRPLTAFGEAQAAALARFFQARRIDAVLHSGLTRTRATAERLVGARTIPVFADARWREADHGAWEGLTYTQVVARDPEGVRQRFADPVHCAPPQGESLADLVERVAEAWRDLGQRFAGQRIVIVTHAGPIQTLLCALFGVPLAQHWRWRVDLGSVTRVDCYPQATILRCLNVLPLHR